MGGDVFVPSALIASAGNNANEYLAKHVAELGYLRPTIVASGGEARRRMGDIDFEVVIINTPLPDEFGHELSTYAELHPGKGLCQHQHTVLLQFIGNLVCGARLGKQNDTGV